MLRLAVLALALGAALAGLSSAAASAPAVPVLDPLAMPWLPEQGVAIQQQHDVELVGLDGHVYGRLPGFTRWVSLERSAAQRPCELSAGRHAPPRPARTPVVARRWPAHADQRAPALAPGRRRARRLSSSRTGYGSHGQPRRGDLPIRDTRSGTTCSRRGSDWGIGRRRPFARHRARADRPGHPGTLDTSLGPTIRWSCGERRREYLHACGHPRGEHRGGLHDGPQGGQPGLSRPRRRRPVLRREPRWPPRAARIAVPVPPVRRGRRLSVPRRRPHRGDSGRRVWAAVCVRRPDARGSGALRDRPAGDTGMAAKGQILGWSETGSLRFPRRSALAAARALFTDGIYLVNPDYVRTNTRVSRSRTGTTGTPSGRRAKTPVARSARGRSG